MQVPALSLRLPFAAEATERSARLGGGWQFGTFCL
jgi:hypothetical protein